MAEPGAAPKSPDYGGRLGYGIFQWVVRLFGVLPAYALLALIAPYYVLFRPSARRSAEPYLRRRFPGRGAAWRFFATIRYFYRFGQVLIDQGAIGILGADRFQVDFPEAERMRALTRSGRGLILVTTHFGGWQSAMANVGSMGVPVSFQFRREAHTEGRHFFDLAGRSGDFRLVSPDVFMGGLLEMSAALRAGECVAVMGDRAFGARTAQARFLGADAEFPISPYHLACVTGADVAALLSVRTGRMRYRLECHRLGAGLDLAGMPREAAICALLEEYVAMLERGVQSHPFLWFNFFDFWKTEEERTRRVS